MMNRTESNGHGVGASLNASTSAPSPVTDSATPPMSMCRLASRSKLSGARRTPSRINAPTPTLNHRIHRHEVASVKKPPSAGAIPPNTALAPPQTPTASPRPEPRKVSVTIASDPGVRTAPPTPTTTRLTISTVALPASAAGIDAAM